MDKCTYCNKEVTPIYDRIQIGTFTCPDCGMPIEYEHDFESIRWNNLSEEKPKEEEDWYLVYIPGGKDPFDSYKISKWKKREGTWSFGWPRVAQWAKLVYKEG